MSCKRAFHLTVFLASFFAASCEDNASPTYFADFSELFVDPLMDESSASDEDWSRLFLRAESLTASYVSGRPRAYKNILVPIGAPTMPAPGKPRELWDLASGYEIDVSNTVTELSFDLIPETPDASVILTVGEIELELNSTNQLSANGLPVGDLSPMYKRQIQFRFDRGLFCVDQVCLEANTGPVNVGIAPTDQFYLSNIQHYEGDRFVLEKPVAAIASSTISLAADIVAWERLSQALADDLRNLYVASLLCDSRRDFLEIFTCFDLQAAAIGAAQGLIARASQWPEWRAYDPRKSEVERQRDLDWATWDRGNWANGYMPLAVATAGSYLEEMGVPVDKSVPEVVNEKGLNYLFSAGYPEIAHWLRRSTNHGQLILGGAWAAGLIANKCAETEISESLGNQYSALLSIALADGGYRESPSYLEVFTLGGLSGPLVAAACDGQPFISFFGNLLPAPGSFGSFVDAVTDNGGNLTASYGDLPEGFTWREDMQYLAASYRPQRLSSVMRARKAAGDSIQYIYQVLRLQTNAAEFKEASEPGCHYFGESGVGIAHLGEGAHESTISLLGMPLHLTHNKGYDIGSITVSRSGSPVLVEAQSHGNAPRAHNAVGIVPASAPGGDAWCGSDLCGGRSINGALDRHQVPFGCAFVARADGAYMTAEGSTLSDYRRTFWAFEDNDGAPLVLLIDDGNATTYSAVKSVRYFNFSADFTTLNSIPGLGSLTSSSGSDGSISKVSDGISRLTETLETSSGHFTEAWLFRLDNGESPCLASVSTVDGQIDVTLGKECWSQKVTAEIGSHKIHISTPD
jgi:hypothetical protein